MYGSREGHSCDIKKLHVHLGGGKKGTDIDGERKDRKCWERVGERG